jgi:hypothetical protein
MKRKNFRLLAHGLSLCTALAVAPCAYADNPASTAQAGAVIEPSKFYDADFDKHVDLRLFGIAFSSLNAKMQTDLSLQLREAERVLGRKHPMITSEQMLEFAAEMASEGKDAETLDRLARVAKADGNTQQVERLAQMTSLVSNSRDLRDEAMFSAMDVERGALAAFANLTLQIRNAELSGDKATLDSLRKAVEKLESLRKPQRNQLYGLIDAAQQSAGDGSQDKTSDLLRALTGASRDLYSGYQVPETNETDTGIVNQPDVAAAIIVDPNSGQSQSGQGQTVGVQTSYATGGMQYLATPSGAVVQSYAPAVGQCDGEPNAAERSAGLDCQTDQGDGCRS